MDTNMHKTMGSVVSLEKIEIIRSQEFMPSEARLKFLKKMIILGPKIAILGPQFCRSLVLGPHFWWSGGGPGPRGPLREPEYQNCVDPPTGDRILMAFNFLPYNNLLKFTNFSLSKSDILAYHT